MRFSEDELWKLFLCQMSELIESEIISPLFLKVMWGDFFIMKRKYLQSESVLRDWKLHGKLSFPFFVFLLNLWIDWKIKVPKNVILRWENGNEG